MAIASAAIARVIAIVNRKGGVGKSTTTGNLAHALALRGRRVLAVDSESQRNLTTSIGQADRRDNDKLPTINEAYRSPKRFASDAIAPSTAAGVDLLYGSTDLEDTEKEIVTSQHPSAGHIMRRIVSTVLAATPYDYVLIDCPPSEGLLTRNALLAADTCIVPTQTDYSGLEGIGRLKDLIIKLDAADGFDERSFPVILALPYFVDERVVRSRELRDYLQSEDFLKDNAGVDLDIRPLASQIHRNEAIADCYGDNVTIFDYVRVDARGRSRKNDDSVVRGRNEFTALAEEIDRG